VAIQPDGSTLVGGRFTFPRAGLLRLKPDGTPDTTFLPQPSGSGLLARALAIQPDGQVLVGGDFNSIAGSTRNNLARLLNSQPAFERLEMDGSTLRWLRSGSGPEVGNVRFDYSTDGTNWVYLNTGLRASEGWVVSHASIPQSAAARQS
jgi:hypothetical protein